MKAFLAHIDSVAMTGPWQYFDVKLRTYVHIEIAHLAGKEVVCHCHALPLLDEIVTIVLEIEIPS